MAKRARQHVIENFNIDKLAKIWIKYLEDLQEEILPEMLPLPKQEKSV